MLNKYAFPPKYIGFHEKSEQLNTISEFITFYILSIIVHNTVKAFRFQKTMFSESCVNTGGMKSIVLIEISNLVLMI